MTTLPRSPLSRLIDERGLTTAGLAQRLGYSTGAIDKWRTGETKPIGAMRATLAEVLGITVKELNKLLAESKRKAKVGT